MNHWRERLSPLIAYVVGAAMFCAGVFLIAGYVWKAMIEPLGKPDQSLLFWLAIFPLAGASLASAGLSTIL